MQTQTSLFITASSFWLRRCLPLNVHSSCEAFFFGWCVISRFWLCFAFFLKILDQRFVFLMLRFMFVLPLQVWTGWKRCIFVRIRDFAWAQGHQASSDKLLGRSNFHSCLFFLCNTYIRASRCSCRAKTMHKPKHFCGITNTHFTSCLVLLQIVTWIILLSVVLHGITGVPLTKRLERWESERD